ncbi:hypothetical protein AVEN_248852-1, partial [Araneus ventricosus]
RLDELALNFGHVKNRLIRSRGHLGDRPDIDEEEKIWAHFVSQKSDQDLKLP